MRTANPINPERKAFLDGHILKGKIPDHFSGVPVFWDIVVGVIKLAIIRKE